MTVASSLLILLSACAEYSDPRTIVIPQLDPRDEKTCTDPGVPARAAEAVAVTRLALADCTRKHKNVVLAYNGVRTSPR